MKLLFDCTELSYYAENSGHKAGVYYVSLNLLKELKKIGVDITFYCDYKRYYFMKNVSEFSDIFLLKENSLANKFVGKLLYLMRKAPIKIRYGLLVLARYYDKYLIRINKKNLNQIKDFDAYFSPFSPPSNEIQKSNIVKFRMLHDVIPIIENGVPTSPKDWYYKIYTSINKEDYYVTNSEYTRKDILKYFPFIKEEKIKTMLLAANEQFYPTQEKPDITEQYIFSLCTLGKRKNLGYAIENFFAFINENNISDLKLVLGGGIWKKYEKELELVVNKFDRSKIILTGYIEESELRKYYSNALCFVYPSLYEGFGLPVLEAMKCGCPVITSNTTSLPEVIGDCGITVNPKENNEMVEALAKMYFDNEFRTECFQKGLERANQFSWEKCAKEILTFIKSTL